MQIRFEFNSSYYAQLPGYILAYWVSNAKLLCFKNGIKMGNISQPRQGIIPGNVEAFLRYWTEVNINKIGFNHKHYSDINLFKKKWFPYNKGGSFRRWYGNLEYIINMENNGRSEERR